MHDGLCASGDVIHRFVHELVTKAPNPITPIGQWSVRYPLEALRKDDDMMGLRFVYFMFHHIQLLQNAARNHKASSNENESVVRKMLMAESPEVDPEQIPVDKTMDLILAKLAEGPNNRPFHEKMVGYGTPNADMEFVHDRTAFPGHVKTINLFEYTPHVPEGNRKWIYTRGIPITVD